MSRIEKLLKRADPEGINSTLQSIVGSSLLKKADTAEEMMEQLQGMDPEDAQALAEQMGFDLPQQQKQRHELPDVQLPEAPTTKAYDAVRWVYQQMYEERLPKIPWRDFQKKFQQFAQKYPQVWMEVRQNRPQVTLEDLDRWLEENKPEKQEGGYRLEQSTYHEPEHSFRDVEQLVLRINTGANAQRIMAQDPKLLEFVGFVAQSSGMSGHPAGLNTVGWLRVDFVDENWLLVDEVQSDLINGVVQAKNMLASPTFEDMLDTFGPNVRDSARLLAEEKGMNEDTFQQMKRELLRRGYTPEVLDGIKEKLADLFEDWAEYGLASLIEIARTHGIKNIAIHSAETIAQRDQTVEADKISMYYDQLAHSFGFRQKQLEFGDLSGNFWVRTARAKKAAFRFYPQTDEWVQRAEEFLREKWAERHREKGREGEPPDLSGACKFASLFAQKLFGGRIRGNPLHQVVKTPHRIIDLTGQFDPNTFHHDKEWFGNPAHEESMQSCTPRVNRWVEEFKAKYGTEEQAPEPPKAAKKEPGKRLVDRPKEYAEARKDPRQTSLYGPGHEQELAEMYAKPKNTYKAGLLKEPTE